MLRKPKALNLIAALMKKEIAVGKKSYRKGELT
jgi:hypothetical protein